MIAGYDPSWGRRFTGREGSESDYRPSTRDLLTFASVWLGLLSAACISIGFMLRVGWKLAMWALG